MPNIFLLSLFTFLIAYAVIDILYEISEIILNKFSRVCAKDFIVLSLSHNDENLDGAVRVSLKRSQNHRCALIIIHNDLDDNEKKVLRFLTDCEKNVVLATYDNIAAAIENAKEINHSLCTKK